MGFCVSTPNLDREGQGLVDGVAKGSTSHPIHRGRQPSVGMQTSLFITLGLGVAVPLILWPSGGGGHCPGHAMLALEVPGGHPPFAGSRPATQEPSLGPGPTETSLEAPVPGGGGGGARQTQAHTGDLGGDSSTFICTFAY